jgi:F0F1-type ATP synthase assembly protein I
LTSSGLFDTHSLRLASCFKLSYFAVLEVTLNPFSRLQKKEKKEFKDNRIAGRLFVIGTNFIAGVAVLGYLGHLLDKRTGHEQFYMPIGAALGIAWALYEALKLAFWLSKEDEQKDDNDDGSKDESKKD